MTAHEKWLAVGVFGIVLIVGGIAATLGLGFRGDVPATGDRTSASSSSSAPGASNRGDLDSSAGADVRRIEHRLKQLESILEQLRTDLDRLESASRSARSVGAVEGGAAAMAESEASAVILEWLEDEETIDGVFDAIESVRLEREFARLETDRRARSDARSKEMTALGESLGLTLNQQDGVQTVLDETEQLHADLAKRAAGLLQGPGGFDEAVRESHLELLAEKRAIYQERTERLESILGKDKLREFRGYENQQDRKAQLYESLITPGFPSTKKRPSPPKKRSGK